MSIKPEKKRDSCEEDAAVASVKEDQEILLGEARRAVERRLVRKLDFRLLPTVVVIYLMNYIDVGCIMCMEQCMMGCVYLWNCSVSRSLLLGSRVYRPI